MTVELPDGLVEYFAERRRQRDDQVRRTLVAMDPRAQRLVREAAVMGFVRGHDAGRLGGFSRISGGGKPPFPGDAQIVHGALSACASMPDLYPTIERARRRGRRVALAEDAATEP